MDRELAGVVIERWEAGYPVSEMRLYKAAEALGVDPMAALVEARFYTYLDHCLLEKRAMSRGERIVFSAAAGLDDGAMVKSASAYGLDPDELIIEALRERHFVPDLQKIANLNALMQQMQGGGGGGGQQPPPGGPMPPPGADPMAAMQPMGPEGAAPPQDQAAAGDAMMAPPDPNAMLQQQPEARIKPSPTGPEQVPADPMGNLDALVQQGQQVYGDQAMQNGGTAPQGMPEPPPPPPSPEERVRQVGPNLDDETVGRYAEQLQRFEEGFGMQINDPKQMVKFVKELQKVDGKKVDQGIKAMGQQLEQEQAQELGVDASPTIDGPGGGGPMVGGAPGGAPGTKMAPKPGGPAEGDPSGNPSPPGGGGPPTQEGSSPQELPPQAGPPGPQSGSPQGGSDAPPQQQKPSRPPPKGPPGGGGPVADAAVEKVAHAARALARATLR